MKTINGKKRRKSNKFIIKIVVIAMFLFFICSSLVLSKRKYLYVESGFKTFSSIVNGYFINKVYSNNKLDDDVMLNRNTYLKKENNELRKALELEEKSDNYVTAEITNNTSRNWFGKVIINKGYEKGIKKDLPVINSSGLIGFIEKTSKYVSEVRLLDEVKDDNMISVMIESDNTFISGMLSDYDKDTNLFKVTGITNKVNIKQSSSVVLSGYANESYKGLYVGEVEKEEIDNYGLSKTIWVKSHVDFDDILFVAVIKEEEK